ncbi:MAG: PQQ-binding-like beta-propeller repeat protein [Sphingomonas fennica]
MPRTRGRGASCGVTTRNRAPAPPPPAAARSAAASRWRGGRVFAATLDGRLLALDAKTGAKLWEVDTIDRNTPWADRYSITGAPRIARGKVIIGNSGAEFAVRGYVTAYDVETGRKAWRFYTVPGKPGVADGAASDPQMAKASATWAGEWWTKGGGGTVWDSIVYDPELDLLYLGTGNGSPWNQAIRSDGKGDNLFVSSIVALRPETGEYVWHYQETPGDTWDYTATQNIILATVAVDGRPRRVLMQAPKNGFFYMLDRATGKLLSATPYAKQTWTTGVDMKTGRPIETPGARYYVDGKPVLQSPGSAGAHNWYPMAFSPQTGLVYIPLLESAMLYDPVGTDPSRLRGNYTGVTLGDGPRLPPAARDQVRAMSRGFIMAWDPVAKRARWSRPTATDSNGGVLATAGGLVFAGAADRRLAAYDATDGRPLWQFDTRAGVSAPPVTYRLDGVQYVALVTGWGGAAPIAGGDFAMGREERIGPNRLLVFRLGAKGTLPPTPVFERPPLEPPATAPDPAAARRGQALFATSCNRCHGIAAVSASAYPDLRRSPVARSEAIYPVVLEGALADRGMPSFAKVLRRQDVDDIRAYLDSRAAEDHAAGER